MKRVGWVSSLFERNPTKKCWVTLKKRANPTYVTLRLAKSNIQPYAGLAMPGKITRTSLIILALPKGGGSMVLVRGTCDTWKYVPEKQHHRSNSILARRQNHYSNVLIRCFNIKTPASTFAVIIYI